MADRGVNFRFSATNAAKNALASVTNGLKKVERQQRSVQALQPSWNRGLNANRRAVQQLGFQLSDFAVQVGGGQSAMLAFTQQGGQMLQFFGPFGAILAALLAVFGSLAIAFTKSGRSLSELIGITGAVQNEFEGLIRVVKSLKEPMLDVLNVIVNNLDTLLITATLVAGFFAARWVASMVAARVATFTLTGALIALRTALIRLGIPALVIAAAYLIERFLTLRQAVGSFGEALALLKDVAVEVFGRIKDAFAIVPLAVRAGALKMHSWFAEALFDMTLAFQDFTWNVAQGLNDIFGSNLQGARIIEGFGQDPLSQYVRRTAEDAAAASTELKNAVNEMTAPLESLQKIRDLLGEPIDVRDWMGGDKGVPDEEGGGGSSAVKKAKEQADKIAETFNQTAKSISSSMSRSFKALLDGTKSLAEATSDILGEISSRVIDLLMNPVFDMIAGNITSAIMGPMVSAGLGPAASFEGGGMTGSGARAGGLDGRGGRLAMLHPDETVVDHRKGGGTGGGSVTVNQYITTPDADSFKRSQRQIARQAKGALG